MKTSRLLCVLAWLLLALCSVGLRAQTAAEPSVHQIYETASRGDLRGAQAMVDDVIRRHPQSAKAHFVKAELAARQRDAATARSELQAAEKLAPGLPFAKPEALSALRSEVDRLATADTGSTPAARPQPTDTRRMGAPQPAPATGGGFPVGGVLIGAVVIGGLFLLLRRRRQPPYDPRGPVGYGPGPAPANPYARDDAFGRGYGPGYPPQPGPDPYAAGPAQGGLGSSLARGLGTGLAVGAGVVAAEEIGRRMFDHGHDASTHLQDTPLADHGGANANSPLAHDAGVDAFGGAPDPDMGGQDFGIADNGGWDDAGGGGLDDVGGGDWDR
jgi:LPXTG-motif cell wall-anchored protein